MIETDGRARTLRPVAADSVREALEAALAGGPPIAPLPDAEVEQRLVLDMLELDTPVAEADAAAVVATSGSTGRPKGVVLSRAAIAASVTATHERLGGPADWVLALPTHYVAGLMVLARSILGGTAAYQVSADLSELPATVDQLNGRRYISLVPTQLLRACASPVLSEALAGFDLVLLGGAAADTALLDRAREQGITVVTTYGMSETCGGCVYDGVPLDGVEVQLEQETGRILLGGPMVFSGYRLRPDLSAEALREGRVVTQDRGVISQGRLLVAGRMDDVVVSGGVNVDLAAVERASQSWPALRGSELVVVGVPNPEWGTEVVAVTNGSGSMSDLRQHLHRTLPRAAAPRRLAQLVTLPRTSSGKIDRRRLVADLSSTPVEKTDAIVTEQRSE